MKILSAIFLFAFLSSTQAQHKRISQGAKKYTVMLGDDKMVYDLKDSSLEISGDTIQLMKLLFKSLLNEKQLANGYDDAVPYLNDHYYKFDTTVDNSYNKEPEDGYSLDELIKGDSLSTYYYKDTFLLPHYGITLEGPKVDTIPSYIVLLDTAIGSYKPSGYPVSDQGRFGMTFWMKGFSINKPWEDSLQYLDADKKPIDKSFIVLFSQRR